MLRVCCAVLVLTVGAIDSPRDFTGYDFEAYIAEFGKSYGPEEYVKRRAIFETSLKEAIIHNEAYHAGLHTWYKDTNQFADWTSEEFRSILKYNRAKHWNMERSTMEVGLSSNSTNPASVDWRTKNVVSGVRNQGHCGACWAFAASETVESQYAIASGKLLSLSPQALVNCVVNSGHCGGSGGCEGATSELGYDLVVKQGIPLEGTVPYAHADGKCSPYKAAVKATGFTKLPVNSASDLETTVATKGPVAVVVAAQMWQGFGGGLFNECSSAGGPGSDLNHGVQVVGYTSQWWIVRNSWGPSFGEAGYIRLSRAADSRTFLDLQPGDGTACIPPVPPPTMVGGECGLLFDASYPTGVTAVSDEISV